MNDNQPSAKLVARAFDPLPLGQVKPSGWLRRQLEIQADGLCGHLDEFWSDVARSRWIGGDAEGWERGPYWLDGIVPLAFLLDDERLIAKARHWVETIVADQAADGWLGPRESGSHQGYRNDPWPTYVVLKALTQYFEATGDTRIPPAIGRCLRRIQTELATNPLRSWARYRWADLVLTCHWLYERTGEPWLLELAALAAAQGFPWREHFARFPFPAKCLPEECDLASHGPNNAMGAKTPGVWFRQSGDPADRDAAAAMIATLDRYHGQATGMFSCDEHLAGRNPTQGSELCAVVEYMFSLEQLAAILGNPAFADRLELVTYNALPATLTPDMWARQYDQQVNQIACVVTQDRVYTSNGPDANIYGLEPHFGCCTPNHGQGWPKFASHLWMGSADGGLAAIAWAPCTVATEIAGTPVAIAVATNYPFSEEIHLTVRPAQPVRFPLHLRIPAWATGATLQVDGDEPIPSSAGTFRRIERTWEGETALRLSLPMPVRAERRFNNAVALYRGPLLLTLPLGEDWRQIGGERPHADWEVRPTTPWNYALVLDPANPNPVIAITHRPLGTTPFSPEGAPFRATVQGRRLPEWGIEHNAVAPPPPSPVTSNEPPEELTLLPYGATNLRLAELPWLMT